MPAYSALLQPFTIRNMTLRNRIVSTAHAPGYGVSSMPLERYRLYHEEKAKGGVALTMIGGSTAVSPDAVAPFGQLTMAEDRAIPHMKEMTDAIHRHGAACICQISHPGRRGRYDSGGWLPPVGPSHRREAQHRSFPKQMEDWDFERIKRDFVAASIRCKQANLDGIELLFAGGHLMLQFFSPFVNTRDDVYGGSLENRMRFALDVLNAVRAGVGENFVIGVRITADEMIEGGLDQADCLLIAKAMAESGVVDYLNVMASQVYNWRSSTASIPSMAFPPEPWLSLASAIKAQVSIPVLHASRIPNLAAAARAIEEGHLDLVGMTRAQIADPHMVNKLLQDREADIRPCVGANYCINRIYSGAESLCLVNPATSREATIPHIIKPSATKRRVVIVGAGPAGLEAARVCGERGHDVVLFEADDEVGGQIRVATQLKWRKQLGLVVTWLAQQCLRLKVDLRKGTRATAKDVLALNPDVVLIATGGRPWKGEFSGADLVATSWDILNGRIAPGEQVLLFDDHSGEQGISCAQFVAEHGAQLEVATPERELGTESGATTFPIYLKALYEHGVKITTDTRLRAVKRNGNRLTVTLRNEYTLKDEEREVDQVISEHGTLPNDELYFALKPMSRNNGSVDYQALVNGNVREMETNPSGHFTLYRLGDAVTSRNVHAAIYDSIRLCATL